MYEVMNALAAEGIQQREPEVAGGVEKVEAVEALAVTTCFNGTREEPCLRGSISQIGSANWTPAQLTAGVLQGICDELYTFYQQLPESLKQTTALTGSGNGLRKNKVLQHIIEKRFGKQLVLATYKEEAAYGSAKFATLVLEN